MPNVTDLTGQISRLREKKTWNQQDFHPTPNSCARKLKLRTSLFTYFIYGLLACAIASQLILLVYFSQ
jgi:hypothetical protein